MRQLEDFAPERPVAYTVSEITESIKDLLSLEFSSVTVVGEISGYKASQAGHLYFALKDSEAVLNAVIWRSTAVRSSLELRNGIEVEATGHIDVYPPRGSYQLIVDAIRLVGEGDLQRKFEELKRTLKAEGLFEESRKKPIPICPQRIAVVTSPTGAAIQDFLKVIRRGYPGLEIEIYPVRVQGAEAPGEIEKALGTLNRLERHEIIVVTRGGGSLEDLWAFNEEIVARAIAASKIPVISAVGHEVDFTISDFVADLRAPTPTAAAALLVGWRDHLLSGLRNLERSLGRSAGRLLTESRLRLEATSRALLRASPLRGVDLYRQRIDDLVSLMAERLRGILQRKQVSLRDKRQWLFARFLRSAESAQGRLRVLEGRLAALSPGVTFRRGFAHVTHVPTGKTVLSPRQVHPGDALRVRVAEGDFGAVTAETDPEKTGELKKEP